MFAFYGKYIALRKTDPYVLGRVTYKGGIKEGAIFVKLQPLRRKVKKQKGQRVCTQQPTLTAHLFCL